MKPLVKFVEFTEVIAAAYWNYTWISEKASVGKAYTFIAYAAHPTSRSKTFRCSEMNRSGQPEIAGQKSVWHNKLDGYISNYNERWKDLGGDVYVFNPALGVQQEFVSELPDGTKFGFGMVPLTLSKSDSPNCCLMYNFIPGYEYIRDPDASTAIIKILPIREGITDLNLYTIPVRDYLPYVHNWRLSDLISFLEDNMTGKLPFNVQWKAGSRLARLPFNTREVILPDPPYLPSINWGDLARQAYDQVDMFDGNGIAFLKDLMEMKEAVSATRTSISQIVGGDHKALLNNKRSKAAINKYYSTSDPRMKKKLKRFAKLNSKAKAISSTFLSFHYGWRLLASDTKEIVKELNKTRHLLSKCQSGTSGTYGGYDYHAVYSCYYEFLGQVTHDLEKFQILMDLRPDLSNAWDMVPYSFVVDWFSNVGDTLQSVDNWMNMYQKHKVLCSIKSIRLQKPVDLGESICGHVNHVYYERTVSQHPVVPNFDLQVSPVNPKHISEGTALVVSNF